MARDKEGAKERKMLPSYFKVNKKLIPIKGHYFFFNAGTAPLVPYLSTYARQLGFSSSTVGLIYTILPVSGLLAKPLFGVLADRFKILKSMLIIFQILTIISFSFIYFLPNKSGVPTVGVGCRNETTSIRTCYKAANIVDKCKVSYLRKDSDSSSSCQMSNCSMSAEMWQHACEQWQLPQFCTNTPAADNLQYTARLAAMTWKDQCAYIAASNVTLDGFIHTPSCRIGDEYLDLDEPCTLQCSSPKLSAVFDIHQTNMTCLEDSMYYRICSDTSFGLNNNDILNEECTVTCKLNRPWKLVEICDSWKATQTATCRRYPGNLTFTANVVPFTAVVEKECVYLEMPDITLKNDTIHSLECLPQEKNPGFDSTTCTIVCNNKLLNRLVIEAAESQDEETSKSNIGFWLFFLLMILSWVGQAVVVTFADVICFNLLGQETSKFGKQRLWGSVGFGIFSLLTGYLIDVFSEGDFKDYTVAFVLMFFFLAGDIAVSCFLKVEETSTSPNILTEVGTLVSSLPIFIFLLWTIAVGAFTGLIWQFLFWLIEDVSTTSCGGSYNVKTLQGLVLAVQTFCGEIPFMHKSGVILDKLGHIKTMNLVLLAFGIRFMLYSFVRNAWWILPIELLQGVTFGMFYPTLTSYANVVSPPGTETTVQGLVGAVFEGLGTSLGSFIGGVLYGKYGGFNTFRWFSYGALTCGGLHTGVQHVLKKRNEKLGLDKEKDKDLGDSGAPAEEPRSRGRKPSLVKKAKRVLSRKQQPDDGAKPAGKRPKSGKDHEPSESVAEAESKLPQKMLLIPTKSGHKKKRGGNAAPAGERLTNGYSAVQYMQENDTIFITEDERKL